MQNINIYLSRILGNKVYTPDGKVIGKLKDLGVTPKLKNQKVTALKIKTDDDIRYLDWRNVSVKKEKGQYVLTCSKIKDISMDNVMLLAKHVLDKQIIDVNGRKVVRVNDIGLAFVESGVFVVAVDVGMEGILRRIGFAKPLKKIGLNIPSKLMLWKDVETVYTTNENIILSKTYNKLSFFHPSDLADIIEDFDERTGMAIFSSLDKAKAADVLEELEQDKRVSVLKDLSTDRAADILEAMPADEVADILDGLSEHKAEELLNEMEKEASDEVRGLMEYDDDVVGSLMSTDFVSFKNNCTVSNAINTLRVLKPEEDQMYYIYVIDEDSKLIGVLSLRDIVISPPEVTLESIMNKDYIYMHDMDDVSDLIKNISKYNLVAIPVVDENMKLLGSVIINDIVYELLKSKRRMS